MADGKETSRTLRRYAALLGAWVWVALTLLLTLSAANNRTRMSWCLVCGERGGADVLLNIVLFAPIGWLFGQWLRPRAAVLCGVALSAVIEWAQWFVVQGRNPSVGDLVFNGTGALLGAWVAARAGTPLRTPLPTGVALAAFGSGAALWLVPVPLGQVLLPDSTYYLAFTPDLAHLDVYTGTVEAFSVDGVSLMPGELPRPLPGGARLRPAHDLEVSFRTGKVPERPAPIVTIHDGEQREILFVGVEGQDVVFRRWRRSGAFRLDQPDWRWRTGAGSWVEGEARTLTIRAQDEEVCFETGRERSCHPAVDPTQGWRFLLSLNGLDAQRTTWLTRLWMWSLGLAPVMLITLAGWAVPPRRVLAFGTGTAAVAALGHSLWAPEASTLAGAWPYLLGVAAGSLYAWDRAAEARRNARRER